jgi:hypothetical protein
MVDPAVTRIRIYVGSFLFCVVVLNVVLRSMGMLLPRWVYTVMMVQIIPIGLGVLALIGRYQRTYDYEPVQFLGLPTNGKSLRQSLASAGVGSILLSVAGFVMALLGGLL